MDLLKHLQSVAHIGYWELNLETEELFWSEVVKEIHEVSQDHQPGLYESIDFYKGNDKQKVTETVQKAMRNGSSWNMKLSIITANGNEKWVRSTGQCILENGKPIKAFGIMLDISDELEIQKKISLSEEKFKLLANNTNDMVALHKADGTFSYVTPASKSIIGYTPSELINKSPYSFFHPDDLERIQQSAHIPVLEKEHDVKIEYRMRHKKGHYVWLETLSKSIFKAGALDFIITSSRDISERITIQESLKKNYEELEAAKNKAEEAANAKKHFLATMSHEIRTPLNAINGIAHLLLLDNPKEDQLENLKLLKFSGDNLLALINDILDISKVDTGKLEIIKEPFNLGYIVDNIFKSLHFKANENNVDFTVDYDKELPQIFISDKNRLSQIVYNLVGNALKFTKDGKVSLYIHRQESKGETYKVRIGVKDDGIGITAEQQKKIFTAFEQADSNITRKYGGTGLGLYITSKLLKLMGSDIKLESNINQGSHFYFDLNLEKGSLSVNNNVDLSINEFIGKKINILVVEDNLANQMIIKKFLRLYHLDYDFANNGKEGLEKVKSKNYNVIFMDLHMPEMDGFEATRKIRKLNGEYFENVPIIALTADAFQEVKSKTKTTGMDDYLSKPFKPEDLIKIISNYWTKVENLKHKADSEKKSKNLSKKVINITAKIEELSSGDREFEIEFANRCRENFIEFKCDLFMSIEQRDKDKIKFSFHKLKSVLLTLGSEELIKTLNKMIDNWHEKEALKKYVLKVEAIIEHHIEKLEDIILEKA